MEESVTDGSARWTILREGVAHAAEVGIDNVRIDVILQRAFASSSSLYHHFSNRAGLIAAIQEERQRLGMHEEDPALLEAIERIDSPSEFSDYIAAQLVRLLSDPATIERRIGRLDALSRAGDNQAIEGLLTGLIDSTSAFIQTAVDRGLCNPDLDARAYAVLFMSTSLGQAAIRNLIDDERWLAVATEAIIAPLRFADPTPTEPSDQSARLV